MGEASGNGEPDDRSVQRDRSLVGRRTHKSRSPIPRLPTRAVVLSGDVSAPSAVRIRWTKIAIEVVGTSRAAASATQLVFSICLQLSPVKSRLQAETPIGRSPALRWRRPILLAANTLRPDRAKSCWNSSRRRWESAPAARPVLSLARLRPCLYRRPWPLPSTAAAGKGIRSLRLPRGPVPAESNSADHRSPPHCPERSGNCRRWDCESRTTDRADRLRECRRASRSDAGRRCTSRRPKFVRFGVIFEAVMGQQPFDRTVGRVGTHLPIGRPPDPVQAARTLAIFSAGTSP